MAGERWLAGTVWLEGWVWANENGETGSPYDYLLGELWGDCKVSFEENLMVGAEFIDKRMKADRGDTVLIAVQYHQHRRAGREFTAQGWARLGRVAREGKWFNRRCRYLEHGLLQPMAKLREL